MAINHVPSIGSSSAQRSSCTVYISRSLTRTLLTVAALTVALLLIVALG